MILVVNTLAKRPDVFMPACDFASALSVLRRVLQVLTPFTTPLDINLGQ